MRKPPVLRVEREDVCWGMMGEVAGEGGKISKVPRLKSCEILICLLV